MLSVLSDELLFLLFLVFLFCFVCFCFCFVLLVEAGFQYVSLAGLELICAKHSVGSFVYPENNRKILEVLVESPAAQESPGHLASIEYWDSWLMSKESSLYSISIGCILHPDAFLW